MKSLLYAIVTLCFLSFYIHESHAKIPIKSELSEHDGKDFASKVKYYAKLNFFQGKPHAPSQTLLDTDPAPTTIGEIARALTEDNFSYTFDSFNALSFVETILALALAGDVHPPGKSSPLMSYQSRFERALKKIRYQRVFTDVPCTFFNQKHLIAANWLAKNKWLLKDITPVIWSEPSITDTKIYWNRWFASHPTIKRFMETLPDHQVDTAKPSTILVSDTESEMLRQDFFYTLQKHLFDQRQIHITFPGVFRSKLTYISIDAAIKRIGTIIALLPKSSCIIVPVAPNHQNYIDRFDTELNTSGIGIVTRFHCESHVVSVSPTLFDSQVTTCTIEQYLAALKEHHPEVVGIHFRDFITKR